MWSLNFISENDFKRHVRETIQAYGEKLEPYDIDRFNNNLIDPIKMIFDQAVYNETWKTIVSNEIFRQRDKSSNNYIGYFNQRMFQYIKDCRVPANGTEGGWDVIWSPTDPSGYTLENGDTIHSIYVEMKNKHNTMNSSSSAKIYTKMQNQILHNDDCACFLVEVVAKKSQNITWKVTLDQQKLSHSRIRRVSIDKFYEIVTGETDAFYRVCMTLPSVIREIAKGENGGDIFVPHDIVYEQLVEQAKNFTHLPMDNAMILSMYMLGFSTYNGFDRYK